MDREILNMKTATRQHPLRLEARGKWYYEFWVALLVDRKVTGNDALKMKFLKV